jgi:hypothetical protein
VGGAKKYPNAGIRVPSAQSVFGFYMDPGLFPDGKTPIRPDRRLRPTNTPLHLQRGSQWYGPGPRSGAELGVVWLAVHRRHLCQLPTFKIRAVNLPRHCHLKKLQELTNNYRHRSASLTCTSTRQGNDASKSMPPNLDIYCQYSFAKLGCL